MSKPLLSFICLFFSMYLSAQTADEIVSKHITAIGGKEVIGKIKSMVTESNISVMGSDLSAHSTLLVGKGFKNVSDFNGQEIIQCITPSGGWIINPLAGETEPSRIPEDQLKAAQSALFLGGDLYNYKEKGNKISLAGKENVEGINAFKIKLTDKEGKESFYFINPSTYYIIKHESTVKADDQDITVTTTFSDYKKTETGYVIPYTTIRNQGFEMTITIKKVEFNKEIDPKIFEMPQ